MEELIKELKKLAERECWGDEEDFNPDDFSGGNYDDAYQGGYDDGQSKLASRILDILNKQRVAE